MAETAGAEEVVGVTEFKARCLGLIDAVATGKLSRVVLTKRGRRVAVITPDDVPVADPWGMHRGSVIVPPGTDLTEPTGEVWDAEKDE